MAGTGIADAKAASPPAALSWLPPGRTRSVFAAFLLAAATLLLYLPVTTHPFLNYDDTLYVTDNEQVQAGLTWPTTKWAFTTFHVGIWHPLTWLSHALDCQLYGLDPSGHHATSLLLHVLNVVLLFWVLQRATGYLGRSMLVAALFAAHPINVESVAWLAERKNLLSMFFFLLALGAYRWYTERPHVRRYSVVAVLFALGLMAKPQVITFPCVLLLWDYWPLRRMRAPLTQPETGGQVHSFGWLLMEKLPLFTLVAADALISSRALHADREKVWFPLWVRLENAIVFYVQYLGKAVWPSKLAIFYPHPGSAVRAWQATLALAAVLAITALVLYGRRRGYLVTGWFWFLGTLVPMLGLAPVGYKGLQGLADRYGYLPFIGLFLIACWGAGDWAERKGVRFAPRAAAGLAVVAALAVLAHQQLGYWRDDATVWEHAVQVTKGNFLAENNLGSLCMKQGREAEGIEHFQRAVAYYPADPVGNLNIGLYELKHGDATAAITRFQSAISNSHDDSLQAAAFRSMGRAYQQLGDSTRSQQCLEAAARLLQ